MDMESEKQRIISSIKKYQYVLLVVLAGVFLMMLPQQEEKKQELPAPQVQESDLEAELALILSKISGVGKAEVLLTEASGSDTIYQTDTDRNQSNLDTVIVTDGNRKEAGLIKQVLPPEYRGAIVVCQGANRADVRLSVVEAVKSVTGISSHCITVLEMK